MADPESLTAPELAAWRGMLVVHARVTARLDAEMRRAHGISLSAYEVLILLADAPGRRLRMSQIAAGALLSRSGCTRLVDRLVSRGEVVREAADDDGRGLVAELTPVGVRTVHAARRTHLAGVRAHFLDALSEADERALAAVWDRIAGVAS